MLTRRYNAIRLIVIWKSLIQSEVTREREGAARFWAELIRLLFQVYHFTFCTPLRVLIRILRSWPSRAVLHLASELHIKEDQIEDKTNVLQPKRTVNVSNSMQLSITEVKLLLCIISLKTRVLVILHSRERLVDKLQVDLFIALKVRFKILDFHYRMLKKIIKKIIGLVVKLCWA